MTRQTPRVLRAWDSVTGEPASTAAATASRATSVASTPDSVETIASWFSTLARNFGSASAGSRSAAVRSDSMAPGRIRLDSRWPRSVQRWMTSATGASAGVSARACLVRASERSISPASRAVAAARSSRDTCDPATSSGSATRSHSSRARSYIFSASKCADDPASAAVSDQRNALSTSCAADQWWAISTDAVPVASSGCSSSSAANRACNRVCRPGSMSSCTTSRSRACRNR